MQIIREVENYTKGARPLFFGSGNFDGVHWGHKNWSTLLERARLERHSGGVYFSSRILLQHIDPRQSAQAAGQKP